MKAIAVRNPGRDYRLVLEDLVEPRPGPGRIVIKVAAAGVNRADLHQARGVYPPPPGAPETLGLEVSGHVVALGDKGSSCKEGDAVTALLAGGGYAEYAVAEAGCALKLPASLDVIAAAALPEALFTAWTNIMDTARLKPGETLLIHGGASGIGVIAIQMFASLGHDVFATAGSDDKCRLCERLGASRAINYRKEDFVAAVKEASRGKGVDVILDMVGGSYVQRNMDAAAVGGRVVNIAYQDGAAMTLNLGPMLRKSLTLTATTLRGRTAPEKQAIRDRLLERVWPLVAQGKILPVVDRQFALADAGGAHEHLK
ncbi:MAG: NAD(P)H-quinone oxidoreductase, partial [Rhizomicrobium sp.]